MNGHTISQELKASFHALPNSPHLTHSWCDYTLLALQGLEPSDITTDKVTRITINGMEQQTRMLGKATVMIYPRIKAEAQRVTVYFTGAIEAPKPLKAHQAPLVSPEDTWGFTAPKLPYQRGF